LKDFLDGQKKLFDGSYVKDEEGLQASCLRNEVFWPWIRWMNDSEGNLSENIFEW